MSKTKTKPAYKTNPRIAKQIEQTRASDLKWDVAGEYHAACDMLAKSHGLVTADLIDEWQDRAVALYYTIKDQKLAEASAFAALYRKFQ